MKKFIKRIIPMRVNLFINKILYSKSSFAQSGEDMILDIIFDKSKGFYVDVGANNPIIQSNTHFLYKKGWKGINIDASPDSMAQFKIIRKRDINLEIPISDKQERLKYYSFKTSFLNTFDDQSVNNFMDELIGTIELDTKKLSQIFDEYLGKNEIDLLNVDVEGWDLKVLRSNNWDKYRPKVIVTEFFSFLEDCNPDQTEIGAYLKENHYKYLCCTPNNSFFLEQEFFNKRYHKQI
jgi:FkbM family methyltransferase